MNKSVLSFAATAALCLLVSADASARSENLVKIPSTIGSCGTCHINPGGGGSRHCMTWSPRSTCRKPWSRARRRCALAMRPGSMPSARMRRAIASLLSAATIAK